MLRTHKALLSVLVCGLLLATVGCGTTGGWVMNNSGMGYYQQGNYAMARHEFAQAVAADPWNADYRHNLAMAMRRSGDTATAERILRHNLSVNVMHQPTYHTLAELLNEQGRQGEAHELVQTWVETQPYVAGAHIEMAWLQREMGNLPDSEQHLRQALQIEPQNAIAAAHLGQLYQDAGQPMQAASMYQRSLAFNRNQPQVQSRLASISPNSIGPADVRLASRTTMLPQPIFGGQMMPGMQPGAMMAMGPQPIPQGAMISSNPAIPAGGQIVSSGSMPIAMPASTTPMETIILPPLESGPMMTSAPSMGPTITGSQPPVITSSPVPVPATGWQPVTQGATAKSLNADPAHVPEMSALPVVTPH